MCGLLYRACPALQVHPRLLCAASPHVLAVQIPFFQAQVDQTWCVLLSLLLLSSMSWQALT